MMRRPDRETNEPNEPGGSEESAWQALRDAIPPRAATAATEGRSMDERPASAPEPRSGRPRVDERGLSGGTPSEGGDHREAPDGGRLVVSVDDDGVAESRPLSDGGTSPPARGHYTVDVTAKTDHGVASHSVASNDVGEAFEELLRWYASRVAPDEDPAAVVDVLLASTDLG